MKFDTTNTQALLDMSPSVLDLSVRCHNCLDAARIKTLRELTEKSEVELLAIRSFGNKTLREIKKKLAVHGLKLNMTQQQEKPAQVSYPNSIASTNSRLRDMPIEDLNLSVRSYNSLKNNGVYTLGELLKKSDQELLGLKAFGRTCLEEIHNKLATFGLSHHRHIEINHNILTDDLVIKDEFIRALPFNIKRIQLRHLLDNALLQAVQHSSNGTPITNVESFLLHEKTTQALQTNDPSALTGILNLLNSLSNDLHYENPKNLISYVSKIVSPRDYEIYLKRNLYHKTLEEIAIELSITRERVRQIEASVDRKIRKSLLHKGIMAFVSRWVEYLNLSPVVIFEKAKQDLGDDLDFDEFKVLCAYAIDNIDCPIYLFTYDNQNVVSKYSKTVLEEAYKSLLVEAEDFVGQAKEELKESFKIDMEYDQAVEDFCLERFVHDDAIWQNEQLIGIRGKNVLNVESVFLTAGQPLHFEEAEKIFYDSFGKEIAFRGFLDRSENIILWGRGTYIHRRLLDLNLEPFDKVYAAIQNALQNHEKKTTATYVFDSNKALMGYMKIPTPQALYSVLRMNDDYRYLYRKYPDIEHVANAESSRKERDDELNDFFLKENRPLYKDELVDYFVKKRGLREYQIFFAMDRCPDIYKMGGGRYAHAKTLGIKKKAIEKIISEVENKLSGEELLILGDLVNELNLPDISPYHWGRQLIASILKKHSDLKVIYHAAVTKKDNEKINNLEGLILHIVKSSPTKFTKSALVTHLRIKKITSNLMTVDKFLEKYGFLLVTPNGL